MFQSVRLDTSLITLVFGVFDGSVGAALHRELEAVVADGVTDIVIDLCQATHVDEGAVAVLAAAAVTVLGVGGRLWLARSDDHGSVFSLFLPEEPPGFENEGEPSPGPDQSMTARV